MLVVWMDSYCWRLTDCDFHWVMNTETLSVDIQPKIHSILSDVALEADSRLSGQVINTVPTACKFLKSCFCICCSCVGSSWFWFTLEQNTVKVPRLFTSYFYWSVTDCNCLFMSHSNLIQNINNKSERTQLLKCEQTMHCKFGRKSWKEMFYYNILIRTSMSRLQLS